jgi:hypothetical protein
MQFKAIYLARRNPSIREEDWPRTWRSHAVFASQFPMIGASIGGLVYCARVLNPTLDGASFEPLGLAPDYDGVAIISSPEVVHVDMPPETQAKMDQDERRVFSTYVREFTLHCKEVQVHGASPGQVAVIRFLVRKADSSQERFLESLSQCGSRIAGPAVGAASEMSRYVHNEVIEEPPPGYPFDAITEAWFPDEDIAVRSLAGGTLSHLARDLAVFCDAARSVTILTRVVHRWPRIKSDI